MSTSRILADFTDFADFGFFAYLTAFVQHPIHSHWSDQKYGSWREAKTAYTHARMLEFTSTREFVIAGLAEAVQKAQDLAASSSSTSFHERVKTLIALSTALHKILRDEQES